MSGHEPVQGQCAAMTGMLASKPQAWAQTLRENVYARQVHEGGGRSLLLSSSRAEAKLWDAGACRDRSEALWTPPEAIGDPLRIFEGVRNAVFRDDGRVVRTPCVKVLPPVTGCKRCRD